MAKRKPKTLTVGFAVSRTSAKRIAEGGVDALPDAGEVILKSGTRFLSPGAAGGYESRLWEKVTCKVLGGLNPEDLVSHPAFGIQKVSAKPTQVRGVRVRGDVRAKKTTKAK
jgi:hypothetical protein